MTVDHGVFADTAELHARADGVDCLAGANRVLIPLFIGRATAKGGALRGGRAARGCVRAHACGKPRLDPAGRESGT
jgi:hypothetical protein